VGEREHPLSVDTLGVAQNDVSVALGCIHTELWMQSVVAAVTREGEEGSLPTGI